MELGRILGLCEHVISENYVILCYIKTQYQEGCFNVGTGTQRKVHQQIVIFTLGSDIVWRKIDTDTDDTVTVTDM